MPDPVRVSVSGVVALSCRRCAALKEALTAAFAKRGVAIEFAPIVWDYEPQEAARFSLEHGIDDIPAFVIGGKVFKDGFGETDVEEAASALGLG